MRCCSVWMSWQPNKLAEDLFLIHNKGTGTEQHRHVSTPPSHYTCWSKGEASLRDYSLDEHPASSH